MAVISDFLKKCKILSLQGWNWIFDVASYASRWWSKESENTPKTITFAVPHIGIHSYINLGNRPLGRQILSSLWSARKCSRLAIYSISFTKGFLQSTFYRPSDSYRRGASSWQKWLGQTALRKVFSLQRKSSITAARKCQNNCRSQMGWIDFTILRRQYFRWATYVPNRRSLSTESGLAWT